MPPSSTPLPAVGLSAAVQVARQRSGTQFDPAPVELFCANAAEVLSGLDGPSQWAQVLGEVGRDPDHRDQRDQH
jgi:hypothetical protein